MSEQPGGYLDTAPRDRTEATVARAVGLLKAYGYFERRLAALDTGWRAGVDVLVEGRHCTLCVLLAQAELVALLAPRWTPERRAAVAMLTEPDAAIREIEATAREGRA